MTRRVVGLRRFVLSALAMGLAPASARAQEGCRYADDGNDELNSITAPGGERITYIRNPHFLCDDGVQIWADSAVAYSAESMSVLIGRVRYLDRARELRSDQARYFSQLGRLQAQGRLHITNSDDGSVIENGDLVYLRETERRPEEEMTVTTGRDGLRPRARVRPAASDTVTAGTAPPAPHTVVADRIVLRGARGFTATGSVEIERDSLFAFADSAEYQEPNDRLLLEGSARVEGGAYDLVARTISIGTAEGDTSAIRALPDAVLTGDDLRLTAPRIEILVVEGAMERLVAVPSAEGRLVDATLAAPPDSVHAARPRAIAESFELTADSIELTAPGEVVERIFAAGSARSVSHARDSLNVEGLPELARYDWLEGDTVVVVLRPVADSVTAEPDTTEGRDYQVDRITARVAARSLYRLPPEDSTAVAGVDPPAVHYVLGDEITIVMRDGEVESMEVAGQTRGVHLEPLGAPPAREPSDTLAAPDTTTMTLHQAGSPIPKPTPPPAGARPAPGAEPWTRR